MENIKLNLNNIYFKINIMENEPVFDIDIESTINFNRDVTTILYRLVHNPDELSLFFEDFVQDTLYNNILSESFEESNNLKENMNINLKQEKILANEEINTECCVCTDNITKNDYIFKCNYCKETFHYNCINKWVKINNSCPKCRNNIETINFEKWV